MDNSIYLKNRKALCDKVNQYDEALVKDISEIAESDNVHLYYNANEEVVLTAVKNGYEYLFNSQYDATFAAKGWANQFLDINKFAPIIVFGMGDCSHIRELIKVAPENTIIVYEPDKNIFYKVMSELDIFDVLSHSKLFLAVNDVSKRYFIEYIQLFINYGNMKLTRYHALPNYLNLYQKEYVDIYERIMSNANAIVFTKNTSVQCQEEIVKNVFTNVKHLISGSDITRLKESFVSIDKDKVPAIIVAAGPSLDKNINELKNAKNKAFIIAVDTALKPVLNAGIKPDITITVDGHKNMIIFDHEDIANVPLVYAKEAKCEVLERHKGKKFSFNSGEDYITHFLKKYERSIEPLETAGSVANNAFSLAMVLGFKNIILIGLDLAYTENKKHSTVVFNDATVNKYKGPDKLAVEVEDIYGQKVYSDKRLKMYLDWFEKQLIRYEGLDVIDATEGGAKIRGTRIMSLKDAIATKCSKTIEFAKYIEDADYTFNEEEKKEIIDNINSAEEQLMELAYILRKAMQNYDKLIDLCRKNKFGNTESKRLADEINAITEKLLNHPFISFIEIYNAKNRYEAMENATNDSNNSNDIKSELKMRKENIKLYLEVIEDFKNDLHMLKA